MKTDAPLTQPDNETIAVPKSALDWLFGEGPDAGGKWFGELMPEPDEKPRRGFWWRSKFRSMIPALTRP